jgi:aminoglycoside phosphotransferase family enzyme
MSELPELIQSLQKPGAYPEPPSKIELLQTQISYVLIADDFVYKIKKPVDMGFLDYSTLEKRLFYCRKEIELNSRLCADAYLGIIPITGDSGDYIIGGDGKVEEYAVKMRRLPQEAMMDVLLTKNSVTPEMIDRVAARLVEFHEKAATGSDIDAFGSVETITINTLDENFGQTERFTDIIIPREKFDYLKDYTANFLKNNVPVFEKRVADGKIRDCHGDLHAAHICFTNGICIYDCIEFIDRLRYTDVAAEIAFLAMDLDRYNRPDLSERFVASYIDKSGDTEIMQLLNFYKCYRAYVRCKVGCFQYDDPYIPAAEKEKIKANARQYYELSESYARRG